MRIKLKSIKSAIFKGIYLFDENLKLFVKNTIMTENPYIRWTCAVFAICTSAFICLSPRENIPKIHTDAKKLMIWKRKSAFGKALPEKERFFASLFK